MKINLADAQKVPFDLDGRIMFSSEKVEIMHLSLKPGEKVERHAQPFDVLFYVIEGNGELMIDDETIPAGKDTLIEVRSGKDRGWSNAGKTSLRLLVIKILNP